MFLMGMAIAEISKKICSLDELPEIWNNLKPGDKEELLWISRISAYKTQIKELFNFIHNFFPKDLYDYANYYLGAKKSVIGVWGYEEIETTKISQIFDDGYKKFKTGIFIKQEFSVNFLSSYFFIDKIREDYFEDNKRLFSIETPYNLENGFDFSDLEDSKKDIQNLKIFLTNN
jgi:hypothetical protein